MKKLILGPILGLETNNLYTVIFLTSNDIKSACITFNDDIVEAQQIGSISLGSHIVWRVEKQFEFKNKKQIVNYQVKCNEQVYTSQFNIQQWQFYIPAQNEKPRFAYCSCNGFSKSLLMIEPRQPYRMWGEMKKEHDKNSFSVLLMGGDQLYSDAIFAQVSYLNTTWKHLSREQKIRATISGETEREIDNFYSKLYIERWGGLVGGNTQKTQNIKDMAEILASIPSIMMWDDHDIIDGWGSYDERLNNCEIYQAIFSSAKRHFELLQIRGTQNKSLIGHGYKSDSLHYSMNIKFGDYTILVLDNRSERSLKTIMGDEHWSEIKAELEQCTVGNLLLMVAIPMVYRNIEWAEKYVDSTFWDDEITDDLKDHWRASAHLKEREKVITALWQNAQARYTQNPKYKTVILSGDVHVGGLGVIEDQVNKQTARIYQVISSGIVHPAPDIIQWTGIKQIIRNDTECLNWIENGNVLAYMWAIKGTEQVIRARNFVTLVADADNNLQASWTIEAKSESWSRKLD